MVWIILVAGLLNLFLGLFVWSKNKKERINILFALFCLIVGIMISINFVFRFIPSINVVKWSYAFSVFLAPVAILWIYELDKKRLSKLKITLLFLPALIFFGINIFSTLIIKNINNLTAFGYIGDTGKLFIYYATYISLCIIFAIGKLYIMQKRSTSLITKLQARYTLIGLMLYASSASFTSLVLPSFFNIYNFTSLDSICSLFFIIFTTYAILKHHLMNIKIIATELFVSIFVLAILFNVLAPVVFQHIIARLILFFVVLIFGILLIRGILKMEKMNEHLKKLLEMKDEFLDIASHQLRTPVTVINGVVSMMREGEISEKRDEKEYRKFVDNVYFKSIKLIQIIEDVLSASRVDTEEFKINERSKKPVQAEEIIREVIVNLKQEAEKKGIALSFEEPETPLPMIKASAFYLEQAIFNLVNNAVIYTLKGFVKVKAREENKKIIIEVSDSGIGIPQEDLPKLFDKFVRGSNAKNAYTDGSGLGLFIVKQLIRAHGSEVSAESEEGKGSVFTIVLPVG